MIVTKNGYPTCNGCQYEDILHCSLYDEECVSTQEKGTAYQIACNSCIDNNSYKPKESEPKKEFKQKAQFHIPNLKTLPVISFLLKLKKDYPYAFYDDREISEIYDAFPGGFWNGRTPLFGNKFLSIQEISEVKKHLEGIGLSLNLTWNNHLIKEEDCGDRFCNLVTGVFHNGNHAITVASPELATYLKTQYPNFVYYKSIIQTTKDKEFKVDDSFDVTLIPVGYNNNFEFLNTIPEEERDKVEFLCNDPCFPLCDKEKHYGIVNYCLKNFAHESCAFEHDCPIDWRFSFYNTQRWPQTINPSDIPTYMEMGYYHFKLSGRGSGPLHSLYYKICKYLVKPEYFEDIYFLGVELINNDNKQNSC